MSVQKSSGELSFALDRKEDLVDSEDISLIPRTSYPSESSSFNVHGVLYVEDSGEVAPVEAEIRALSTGLQGVKDEQEYIVVRERVHRDSECRESTASFLIEGELAKWLGLGLGISSGGIHRKYSFVMGPRAVSRDSCCFFLSLSLSSVRTPCRTTESNGGRSFRVSCSSPSARGT